MQLGYLHASRRRVRLKNLPYGLFRSSSGELCLLTEYGGEAYVVSTGEAFWGGTSSPEQRALLLVHPVKLISES